VCAVRRQLLQHVQNIVGGEGDVVHAGAGEGGDEPPRAAASGGCVGSTGPVSCTVARELP
jgi:hypothetical protein